MILYYLLLITLTALTCYAIGTDSNLTTNIPQTRLYARVIGALHTEQGVENTHVKPYHLLPLPLFWYINPHYAPIITVLVVIAYTARLPKIILTIYASGIIILLAKTGFVSAIICIELVSIVTVGAIFTSITSKNGWYNAVHAASILIVSLLGYGLLFCAVCVYFRTQNHFLFIKSPTPKTLLVAYFAIKFGNVFLYGTKKIFYDIATPQFILILAILQFVTVPSILFTTLESISNFTDWTLIVGLFVLNFVGLYQMLFTHRLKNLVLFTAALTNLLSVIFIIM